MLELMQQYYDLIRRIIANGEERPNRTGHNTLGLHFETVRFDISGGIFPLITGRDLTTAISFVPAEWQALAVEGSHDERRLAEIQHGSRDSKIKTIWSQNVSAPWWQQYAKFPGDMGPYSYGPMMRAFPGEDGPIDQLTRVIEKIRANPFDRRHIVTMWHPGNEKRCALPPCHKEFAFYHHADGTLSLGVEMRSWDVGIGAPANIAYYAIMLNVIAHLTDKTPFELCFLAHDAHIYKEHVSGLELMLERIDTNGIPPLPQLHVQHHDQLDDYRATDIQVTDYHPYPRIKFEMF